MKCNLNVSYLSSGKFLPLLPPKVSKHTLETIQGLILQPLTILPLTILLTILYGTVAVVGDRAITLFVNQPWIHHIALPVYGSWISLMSHFSWLWFKAYSSQAQHDGSFCSCVTWRKDVTNALCQLQVLGYHLLFHAVLSLCLHHTSKQLTAISF
jgi:hypothetical protein